MELTFWQGVGAGVVASVFLFTPKGRSSIGRGMGLVEKGIQRLD